MFPILGTAHQTEISNTIRKEGESESDFKARRNLLILNRRGVFKWLPVGCSNDMVLGSWWYVWGSVLCIIIPVFPLVQNFNQLWTEDDHERHHHAYNMPLEVGTAVFALLIFLGILYTIGSYAFLRAVETPAVPPLCGCCYHFQSDELLGMWTFFLGTVPTVPISALLMYYNPESTTFKGALFISVFFCAVFAYAVKLVYPRDDQSHTVHWVFIFFPCLLYKDHIAPLIKYLCCGLCCLRKHVATDWLIVSWLIFFGCIACNCICAWLLVYAIAKDDGRAIYDWATGLFDMLFFTVGSMYFVAGAYDSEFDEKPVEIEPNL